ncbi:MAG TPA: hypothetical protein VGF94_01615 [Kofleriaceae bacterium]|jgi:hypothetical protein
MRASGIVLGAIDDRGTLQLDSASVVRASDGDICQIEPVTIDLTCK